MAGTLLDLTMQIAGVIRPNRFHFRSDGIKKLADLFEVEVPGFDRSLFYARCDGKAWQPQTGKECGCRPGVERDNCPTCEGTGQRIDFAKIRAQSKARQ